MDLRSRQIHHKIIFRKKEKAMQIAADELEAINRMFISKTIKAKKIIILMLMLLLLIGGIVLSFIK